MLKFNKNVLHSVNNIPSRDVTYCGWLRLPIRVKINSSIWSARGQGKSLINLVIAGRSLTKIASSKRSLMTSIRYQRRKMISVGISLQDFDMFGLVVKYKDILLKIFVIIYLLLLSEVLTD